MRENPVSFAMFLIDRGALDGYTLGQWMGYVRTSSLGEFNDIMEHIIEVPGYKTDRDGLTDPSVYIFFFAYLYPEEWKQWLAICRLTGEPIR